MIFSFFEIMHIIEVPVYTKAEGRTEKGSHEGILRSRVRRYSKKLDF